MGSFCPVYLQLPATEFYQLRQDEQLLSSGYFSLAQDDYGFIWMGSYWGGGVYRFDGYNLVSFVIDPSDLTQSLSSNNVNSLYCPGDNLIYVSSHGRLNTIDLTSGEIRTYPDDIGKIPDRKSLYITKSINDDSGRLWIASSYGLSIYNLHDSSFQGLLPDHSSFSGPHPERIRDLALSHTDNDVLWLGSYHGLFSYQISKNKYDFYASSPKIEINRIAQDNDGILWLTLAQSKIIVKFNPASKHFSFIDISEILDKDEFITGITFFNDPNIWISTSKTVGIFDPDSLTLRHWNVDTLNRSGLLPNGQFADIINDRHGRIWIGSEFGIQYSKKSIAPPRKTQKDIAVQIINIKATNERSQVAKPLNYRNSLSLKSDQRDLEIQFVLPNPLHPDDVDYQYRLEGYDTDWIETKNRSVRYSKLPGGDYKFLVRGREPEANFTNETHFNISIEKVITEELWFWVASLGSLSLMVFAGVFLRFKSIRSEERRKAKYKQDLAEIQMLALRSQMNPHFLFNSLNSLKYYVLSKSKDETAEYLGKFALLVRTILNHSKQKSISLMEELNAIKLYIEIENLRLENKFDYHVEIDPSIAATGVSIPPMVMQPYVENAIWHGLMPLKTRGKLLLEVKNMGDRIQCIIEDNGIGREAAKALTGQNPPTKKSMGMQISQDRLELLKQAYGVETRISVIDLIATNGKALGTRILVEIPLFDLDTNNYSV